MTVDREIVRDWLAAKKIIAGLLREVCPQHTDAQIDHNAAAVIARLAQHDPPLLICSSLGEPVTDVHPADSSGS
jgi:hypothetical protein